MSGLGIQLLEFLLLAFFASLILWANFWFSLDGFWDRQVEKITEIEKHNILLSQPVLLDASDDKALD